MLRSWSIYALVSLILIMKVDGFVVPVLRQSVGIRQAFRCCLSYQSGINVFGHHIRRSVCLVRTIMKQNVAQWETPGDIKLEIWTALVNELPYEGAVFCSVPAILRPPDSFCVGELVY